MEEHQGKIIEYVVRRNGYNISDLARGLGVNRRTLYNYFKSPSVKVNIIHQVGTFLRHDFSQEFPELYKEGEFETLLKKSEKPIIEKMPLHKDDAIYKAKYIELLEKYHELLNTLSETN